MIQKLKKLAFSRVFIVGLLIAAQLFLILMAALEFTKYFVFYYIISFVLALGFVLRIIDTKLNMAYKLAWIVIIFIFPAFGVLIYIVFCGNRLSEKSLEQMRFMSAVTKTSVGNRDIIPEIREVSPETAKQTEYIANATLCPPYKNCKTVYYPTGEEMFEPFLAELEKAEKYIFIEYFIIGYGKMWDKIHKILKRKAESGIDVRVIYDDIGCIMTLKRDFAKELEKEGIKCRVFHKFTPVLSARQNNRDHRKICVVDGITAFTGGINIADEYINEIVRFGYWKDNAVMVQGEAAWSFTVMFLTMWDYLCRTSITERGNYAKFKPSDVDCAKFKGTGIVQPYTDSPLDNEPVGENIYLGMLSAAHDYVWITTPYLIIDEQMEQALCRAVKSGVDVRIVTPGIPDKKIVNETTKSFYPNLIANGVKIYEYSLGFIHAKTFLCDDKYATVGSVNLDYRSLYLHFECGLWMSDTECILDIKDDFEKIFEVSRLAQVQKSSSIRRLFRGVLELLAPLL